MPGYSSPGAGRIKRYTGTAKLLPVLAQRSEIFDEVADFVDREVLRHLGHCRRRGGLFVSFVANDTNRLVLESHVFPEPIDSALRATHVFFRAQPLQGRSFRPANSHLKCKASFVESFQWSEIVESLSRSIVEAARHVCKGVV